MIRKTLARWFREILFGRKSIRRRRTLHAVERCEPRLLPATFVVSVTSDAADADANDGVIDVDLGTPGEQVSLRAAINAANAASGADVVQFAIPNGSAGRVPINVLSALPTITASVTLDATAQAGGGVILDGGNGAFSGLIASAGTITLKSVTIMNFGQHGLLALSSVADPVRFIADKLPVIDNGGDGIRATGSVEIQGSALIDGNAGWGVSADGSINIDGALLAGSPDLQITNNGQGGILSALSAAIHRANIYDNGASATTATSGDGIRSAAELILSDVNVSSNRGNGVFAQTSLRVLPGTISGWTNSFLSNQKSGIRVVGGSEGEIHLASHADVNNNQEYGVLIEDGLIRFNVSLANPNSGDEASAAISHISNNGFGGIYAGGVGTGKGIRLNRAEVLDNGHRSSVAGDGHGIHADEGIGLRNVKVIGSFADGVSAAGSIRVFPTTADDWTNEFRSNRGSGIHTIGGANKGIHIQTNVDVTNNLEYGIIADAGAVLLNVDELVLQAVDPATDVFSHVSNNGLGGIYAGGLGAGQGFGIQANRVELRDNGLLATLPGQGHGIHADEGIGLSEVKVIGSFADGVNSTGNIYIYPTTTAGWTNEISSNGGSGIYSLGGENIGIGVYAAVDVILNSQYGIYIASGAIFVNTGLDTNGVITGSPTTDQISHIRNNGFNGIYAGGTGTLHGVRVNRAELIDNGHLATNPQERHGIHSDEGVGLQEVKIVGSEGNGVDAIGNVVIFPTTLAGWTNEIRSNNGSGIEVLGGPDKRISIQSPINITDNVQYGLLIRTGSIELGDATTTAVSRVSRNSLGGLKADEIVAHAIQFFGNNPAQIAGAGLGDVDATVSVYLRAPDVATEYDVRNLTVPATLFGGAGNDVLIGGTVGDVISGRGGDDVLHGWDGDDVIAGGDGDDRLFGGPGDDSLFGRAGSDLLIGGAGTNMGDGTSDLSVTLTGDPDVIEVGGAALYRHVFVNFGPDIAVDANAVGGPFGVISAELLERPFGTEVFDPVTGQSTGHKALDLNQPTTKIVAGTGERPGRGGYRTLVSLGEADVYLDPLQINNLGRAETEVRGRVSLPKIQSEETKRGRTQRTNSSGPINDEMILRAVSGNGNWTATQTDADVFPGFSNPSQKRQIAIGDPILGSVSFSGTEVGNGHSESPTLSFDGTKVAFLSFATNLVEGFIDNNSSGQADVYFRNLVTGETRLVTTSVNRAGSADIGSTAPLISDDGRFVIFASGARDLIAGDANNFEDIFAYDTLTGTMELVSVAANGTQANSNCFLKGISHDGRFVLFSSNAVTLDPDDHSAFQHKLFVKDRQTGTVKIVSADAFGNVPSSAFTNLSSGKALITPDGRYVAFTSSATTFVSGVSDTAGTFDLFVKDMQTAAIQIVSVSRDGTTARGVASNSNFNISDNGQTVAFGSLGTDLATDFPDVTYRIYARNLTTGVTVPLSLTPTGDPPPNQLFSLQSMDSAGRFVAFVSSAPGLVSGVTTTSGLNVFIRDLANNTTSLASRNSFGTSTGDRESLSAILSRDGKKVFFTSDATDLVRHFTDGGTATRDLFSNSDHVSLVYIAPNGNGADDLTLRRNGDFLEIFDNRADIVVARRRADDTEAVLIQGSDNENDTIRVDFSGGSLAVPSGIQFDGGLDAAGTNQDQVIFSNGSFDTVQYDLTGAASGFVSFDDAVFVYDFTEPLVDLTPAATRIVNNWIAGNQQMTLQDDGTANNGLSRVAFTGPNSPPSLTFANPNESLEFHTFVGNDTFQETGRDAGLLTTVEDNVTPPVINAAPDFTPGPNQTVAINSGERTVANWAKDISAGAAHESAQVLTFLVITDNDSLFATLPAVSPTGALTFTPATDAVGMANVFVRLMDDGGTDNGGIDVSDFQPFTISVVDGLVGPTFTAGPNQTVDEDSGLHTIENWATNLTAPNVESPTFSFVVTNDNNSLFSTQPMISPTGTLSFRSAPNTFGEATVTVKLLVNNGESESADQTFTITVNDVAEPVFNPVTLTLAAANANTRLQVNATTNHVELVNAATNAVLLDLTADGVTQLTLNGGREDNRLTVDFTNGNPLPSDGLFFNGGQQRRHDDLVLTGGSFDSVTHTFDNQHDGTVTIDGATITYTGLEPITDNLAAVDRVFEFAASNDSITLADAARATNGRLKMTSVRSSESVEFAAPTGSLTIRAGAGNDIVTVRSLDPNFVNSAAELIVEGGAGNDSLDASRVSKSTTLLGGSGRDTLQGSSANDVLQGGDDRDLLIGNRGDDTLSGDAERDDLRGGNGNDSLSGGEGDDSIRGDAGSDQLFGDSGHDTLRGDADADVMFGGADNDFITGGSGDDCLSGGDGNDRLFGEGGNDRMRGDGNNDSLRGGSGDDILSGGLGADTVKGDSGTDRVGGGNGAGPDVGDDVLHFNRANEIDEAFLLDDDWNILV